MALGAAAIPTTAGAFRAAISRKSGIPDAKGAVTLSDGPVVGLGIEAWTQYGDAKPKTPPATNATTVTPWLILLRFICRLTHAAKLQ